jgi:hypothetical protein
MAATAMKMQQLKEISSFPNWRDSNTSFLLIYWMPGEFHRALLFFTGGCRNGFGNGYPMKFHLLGLTGFKYNVGKLGKVTARTAIESQGYVG